MCGIIAAFNKKGEVNDWVVNQYEEQYNRGTDGFGEVLIDKDGSYKVLRACEPTKALIDLYMNKSEAIVMHHRTPTSTDNWLDQTHPIKVSDGSLKYDYLVVHNGCISNADTLKTAHEKLGFTYNTAYETTTGVSKFNDSEALAIEVARFIEEQTKAIGTQGSAAFVALQVTKDKKNPSKLVRIFFGRNDGSPLNMSASNKKVRISSEGEGEEVKSYTLYSFTTDNYKFKKKNMPFVSVKATEKETDDIGYSLTRISPRYDGSMYDNWVSDKISTPDEPISSEREKIIKEFKDKIIVAADSFADELSEDAVNFLPNAAWATGEIADAVYEAERKMENLIQAEMSVTAAPKTAYED